MTSVIPRKALIAGFHFCKFGCCKLRNFQKKFYHKFFGNLAVFFRIDIKNNSWRIAQKILSKKVKQILQRKGEGQ